MNAKDVKCPICGTVNRSLDLDETDGWMECEHCHNAVQILEYATESTVIQTAKQKITSFLMVHLLSKWSDRYSFSPSLFIPRSSFTL